MDNTKNDPDCLNCGIHGRCSCSKGSIYCKHLYSVNREDRLFESKGIGYPGESVELLKFIFARMLNVHGENNNCDYMIKFRNIINTIAKDSANFNINQQMQVGSPVSQALPNGAGAPLQPA